VTGSGHPSPGGRSRGRRWRLVRARGEVPRRRVAGRRRTLRWMLLGLLGTLLVGGAAWALLGTSLVGVRHVEISGVEITTREAVHDAAAVTLGTSLLRLDTIAARVGALPPVAHVDVRRSFPHTLVITVTERTPAAVVPAPDGYAVLAADGVVYHHVATPPDGVPVVQLEAPGPTDPATLAALRVVAALTPELRAVLAEIRAPAPTRISLALVDGRTIVWGDAEASDRKAAVATVLLAEDATTIDVSVPDIATVR